jgi:hypothetical protein
LHSIKEERLIPTLQEIEEALEVDLIEVDLAAEVVMIEEVSLQEDQD